MTYSVEWTASAQRALARLPEKVALVVVELVYGPLVENPQRLGHPLRYELEGRHTVRRGDYRVVYRIDEARHAVTIEAVAHRSDVYRRP